MAVKILACKRKNAPIV